MKSSLFALCLLASVAMAEETMGPPTNVLPRETVVAKRGDTELTLADVDGLVMKAPELQRAALVIDDKRLAQMLESTMLIKQLAQRGTELKLNEHVDYKLRLQRALEEELATITVEHLGSQGPKQDYSLLSKEYFLANPAEFQAPTQNKVQHLLVSITESRDEEAAQALAANYLAIAKKDPKGFGDLVVKHSDDSGSNGSQGVLVVDQPDVYVKEFDEAARNQAIGSFAVIRTQFGFHVLTVVERTPGIKRSYEDSKDGIEAKMKLEEENALRAKIISDMRSANFDSKPEVIESIQTRYGVLPSLSEAEAKANAAQAQPAPN
jgi:parvulin-like peptidyl-prolyl isomerase